MAPIFSEAQECDRILESAEQDYKDGRLYEVSSMLDGCIKNGFNKLQRERAYKLLALTHLFLDDNKKAETYLLRLLQSNPQFKISPLDPPEFEYLFNGFTTSPRNAIIFKAGPNFTFVNELTKISVDNAFLSYESNKFKPGYQIGIGFDFRITPKIDFNFEVLFSNNRFKKVDSLHTTSFNNLSDAALLYNFTTIQSTENQFWFDLPISLKYNLKLKKMDPFVYVGGALNYLIGDNLNVSRISIDPEDEETPQRKVEGPPVKLLASGLRKNIHYSIILGAGLKYKVGIDYVFIDVRYNWGVTNLRNTDLPLNAHRELLFKYGYLDNDFKVNAVSVSIGYIKPFYKAKKIKKSNRL